MNGPVILWNWLASEERGEQDCACPDGTGEVVVLPSLQAEAIEDDCACPDGREAVLLASPVGRGVRRQRASGLYRAALPDRHEVVFQPLGPAAVVVLNRTAAHILDAFALPATPAQVLPRLPGLATDAFHRAVDHLSALNLLQPTEGRTPSPALPASPPTTLTAWLHLTSACNLACTYCYLRLTGETMDVATGRAALQAIFRTAQRHGFSAVKLKYAGGEPTLHFDLLQTLHREALALARQTGLGLQEVVLSNGTRLDDGMLDFLRDAAIRLAISWDGPAHDAQRPFVGGRGSAARVARTIDRALAQGLRPHLSITVTAHNVESLPEAVAFALDRGLLFNLNFYRGTGRGTPLVPLTPDEGRLIAALRQALAVIEERLPPYSLIAGLLDRVSLAAPHRYPCGVGHAYLVVDPRGQIARCQMEIEHPVTDVWTEDPLTSLRVVNGGFQNLPVEQRERCRACPWRYWCAGGCPLLTHRLTGRSDRPSPYCRVYKTLFPEVLRLEGLRLLRWKDRRDQGAGR